MNHITLAWTENGERVTRKLEVGESTISPGGFRIGRDPERCDVVMPSETDRDRTVSRCHVEVAFDSNKFGFYLKNLKANNPPYILGSPVTEPFKLTKGCIFELGEVEIEVADIAAIPETIIVQRAKPAPPQDQVTILSDRSSDDPDSEPPTPEPIQSNPVQSNPIQSKPAPNPLKPKLVEAKDIPAAKQPLPTSLASPSVAPSPAPTPTPAPSLTPTPTPLNPVNPTEPPADSPAGSVFDRVKDQLFSCPNGHKYTLAEAKELGWICKYDGYLITSTFVAK